MWDYLIYSPLPDLKYSLTNVYKQDSMMAEWETVHRNASTQKCTYVKILKFYKKIPAASWAAERESKAKVAIYLM